MGHGPSLAVAVSAAGAAAAVLLGVGGAVSKQGGAWGGTWRECALVHVGTWARMLREVVRAGRLEVELDGIL